MDIDFFTGTFAHEKSYNLALGNGVANIDYAGKIVLAILVERNKCVSRKKKPYGILEMIFLIASYAAYCFHFSFYQNQNRLHIVLPEQRLL